MYKTGVMKSPIFEATLDGDHPGVHSVMIPIIYAEPFLSSKAGRVKVEASFDQKKVSFHAALQKDRSGNCRIIFNRKNQKSIGIYPSDYFNLQLFEDNSKYGVDMPEELEAVLISDHEAYEIFESLTSGRQRSIIYSISRYKNSQTKIDKSLIIAENLKRRITDPKLLLKKL